MRAAWRSALALVMLCGCVQGVQVLGPGPGVDAGPDHDAALPSGAMALTLGGGHGCAVLGGNLVCWGENAEHALAQPDTRPRETSVRVGNAIDWSAASAGYGSTCGVRGSSVFCWGAAGDGRLGTGSFTSSFTPERVLLPRPVASISARFAHACALLVDGTLHCWGDGDEGQLAQDEPFTGPGADHPTPVQVAPELRFIAVANGQGHTCAIETSGALYCWGRNVTGILGLGPGVAEQIRTPQRVGDATDWVALSAGQHHNCALRADSSLWCWGSDGAGAGDPGALGIAGRGVHYIPTQVGSARDWVQIDTDTFHTCGIRASGQLWCWGRNDEGQLGTGDLMDRDEPTRIGTGSDWVRVATGRFHTCAMQRDATISCTGANEAGQLGVGDFERRRELTPVIGPLLE